MAKKKAAAKKAPRPTRPTAAKPKAEAGRLVDLDQLTLDPGNSCIHDERNLEVIAGSIQEVGAGRSVLMDADGIIRAGNGTVQGAGRAGLKKARIIETDGTELIVVKRTDLHGAKAVAAGVADNRASDLHSYDAEKLKDQLAEIEHELPDLDLDGIGLATEEIDGLLADLKTDSDDDSGPNEEIENDDAPNDRAKELQKQFKTRKGQLWLIKSADGERTHRLFCGDSTNGGHVKQLLEGVELDGVVSDPPYCSGAAGGSVQEAGKSAGSVGSAAKAKFGDKIRGDTLSTRGFVSMIKMVLEQYEPAVAYLFTDWRMWCPLFDSVEASGLAVKSMIVWDKGTPGMGLGWRTQHELIMFGASGKTPFKPKLGVGNVIQSSRTGNLNHKTEKPVDLMAKILQVSDFLQVVADPFNGSGTTMVAAEKLGRVCCGMEFEPRYVAVTLQRMTDLGCSVQLQT